MIETKGNQKSKYYFDYYRMTGEAYKPGLKSYIKKLLFHNLQFAFWFRKNEEHPSLLSKLMLYELSRKYGLEISSSAKIGDCVFVGINSTIVGAIHIGNDVLIAPNSYVNIDVPDHSIVIGNPATIHHRENATKDYVVFTV